MLLDMFCTLDALGDESRLEKIVTSTYRYVVQA